MTVPVAAILAGQVGRRHYGDRPNLKGVRELLTLKIAALFLYPILKFLVVVELASLSLNCGLNVNILSKIVKDEKSSGSIFHSLLFYSFIPH